MKTIVMLIVLTTAFFIISSEVSASAGGAAPYLRMGVGARARSLGKAFTAVADDATANYYNPAGMVQIENIEATFMLSKLSLDRKLSYIGYIHEVNGNYFGLSFLGFGIDDIEERGMDPNASDFYKGNFDFGNSAYKFSFGRNLNESVSIGISAKYLDSQFKGLSYTSDGKATGYGIDIGFLYRVNENLRTAIVIQDLWSKLDWKTNRKETIPNVIKIGGSYTLLNGDLLLSGEIERESFSKDTKLNIGCEWWIVNPVAIRLGLRDTFFSGGLGFKADIGNMKLLVDYAYLEDTFSTDYNENAGHQFSLGLRF